MDGIGRTFRRGRGNRFGGADVQKNKTKTTTVRWQADGGRLSD